MFNLSVCYRDFGIQKNQKLQFSHHRIRRFCMLRIIIWSRSESITSRVTAHRVGHNGSPDHPRAHALEYLCIEFFFHKTIDEELCGPVKDRVAGRKVCRNGCVTMYHEGPRFK